MSSNTDVLAAAANRLRAMLAQSVSVSLQGAGGLAFYVFPESVAEAIETSESNPAGSDSKVTVADRVRYMVEVILVRAKTEDGEAVFPVGRRSFDRQELIAKTYAGDLYELYGQIVAADATFQTAEDFTTPPK